MARVDTLIYGVEAEARKRLANLESKRGLRRGIDDASNRGQRRTCGSCGCFMGCLPPSRRIRNRRSIIRSAMRSPPMTATSIRTTQNYGRLPSGLMKTASRSPTNRRLSTAIPTIGPIPRKGHRFVPPQPQTDPPSRGGAIAAMARLVTSSAGKIFQQSGALLAAV